MKIVVANVTIKFKRSGIEQTYKETYYVENGKADLIESIKNYHLENGNHNVTNAELLKVTNVSYYPTTTFCGYLIK